MHKFVQFASYRLFAIDNEEPLVYQMDRRDILQKFVLFLVLVGQLFQLKVWIFFRVVGLFFQVV